jgi:hypothetical protein
VWTALAGLALAHPAPDERLAAHAAAAGACAAEVWLAQAEALRSEGRVDDGLAALQRARGCGADPLSLALGRGLLLAGRDPARAVAELDAVLGARPEHAGARAVRARALAALGRPEAAIADLRALGPHAGVDDRVLLVRLLTAAGRPEEALAAADEGPPAPALVEAAVRLEVALGRPEAAHGRLDALPAQPHWVALRSTLPELR